mgnify:CR=1 FL=1
MGLNRKQVWVLERCEFDWMCLCSILAYACLCWFNFVSYSAVYVTFLVVTEFVDSKMYLYDLKLLSADHQIHGYSWWKLLPHELKFKTKGVPKLVDSVMWFVVRSMNWVFEMQGDFRGVENMCWIIYVDRTWNYFRFVFLVVCIKVEK